MSEERDRIGTTVGEPKRRLLTGIAVVSVLLAAAVVAAGLLQPKRYFAKVTMEVRPLNATVPVRPPGSSEIFRDQQRHLATQLQLMREREILYPVIERLNLGKAFVRGVESLSAEEVYPLLLRSLDFRVVPKTHLVNVGVYSRDPQLAAAIANNIAIVYSEKVNLAAERMLKDSISRTEAALKAEIQKQRKVIEQAAAEMAELRDQAGIRASQPVHAAKPMADMSSEDHAAFQEC